MRTSSQASLNEFTHIIHHVPVMKQFMDHGYTGIHICNMPVIRWITTRTPFWQAFSRAMPRQHIVSLTIGLHNNIYQRLASGCSGTYVKAEFS